MELWHGGKDLEYYYDKPKTSTKGRWEGGPGLYLTTHYETARKYSKGGGATYKVDLDLGNHAKDVFIPIQDVVDFISSNVVVKHRKSIIEDIHDNAKRTKTFDKVCSEVLINLCINYEALKGDKTLALNTFLVENNVGYNTIDNFSGRPETVVVLFDLASIKKVKKVPAKDVSLDEWELVFDINSKTRSLKP